MENKDGTLENIRVEWAKKKEWVKVMICSHTVLKSYSLILTSAFTPEFVDQKKNEPNLTITESIFLLLHMYIWIVKN